jgi:hypothetical protein
MSNYSDAWLKDNLFEAKLAILEAESRFRDVALYSSRPTTLSLDGLSCVRLFLFSSVRWSGWKAD